VVLWSSKAGGDEHGADLVAVETSGMGLVVESGPSNMRRGRLGGQVFLFGVAVEAGDRAEPPCDRGSSSSQCFETASEALDVSPRAPNNAIRRSVRHCTY
jgi:hypothetical protein